MNDLLFDTINSATVDTRFPEEELGAQLETIAKLIKTKDVRGADRDVFYAKLSGFDTHGDKKLQLGLLTTQLNNALEAFTTEMKGANYWDDITIVGVSEFGRTLTENSGKRMVVIFAVAATSRTT